MTVIKKIDEHTIYQNPIPQLRSRCAKFPGLAELPSGELIGLFEIGEAFESVDSVTYLSSFLKDNLSSNFRIETLDLNLEFHLRKFSNFQKYAKIFKKKYVREEYNIIATDFKKLSFAVYSDNNKRVVQEYRPELFSVMLKKIIDKKPDVVCFSLVYSSQSFYSYALIEELVKRG